MFSDGRESWRARPLRHSCRGRDGQDADNKSALLAAPAGTTPDLVFSRRILLVSDRAPRTEPSRIDRRRRKEASATIGHELAPRSVAQDKARLSGSKRRRAGHGNGKRSGRGRISDARRAPLSAFGRDRGESSAGRAVGSLLAATWDRSAWRILE